MRNVSDKSGRENPNTHFVLSDVLLNRALFGIMWRNIVQQATDDNMAQAHCMLDN
jgi:hypothetical protein